MTAEGRPAVPVNGWRIVRLVLAILGLCLAFVLWRGGGSAEGLQAAIRVTARTSFACFVIAFSASSTAMFLPSGLTRWQLANRRYFGVSFGLSHLLHAGAIFSLAAHTGGRTLEGRMHDLIAGSFLYGIIVFMLVTSFDRSAAWVGPRVWKTMHTIGGYLIFLTFLSSYGGRATESWVYLPQVMLLVSVLGLRIARRVRRSRSG